MKTNFSGAIVMINGGASGIGKQLAMQIADLGATVIVADRKLETNLAPELQNQAITYQKVNLENPSEAKLLFGYTIKTHRRIDYVFNCAGVFLGGEVRDTSLKDWHEVVNNNVLSVFNGTHHAYQIMLKQGHGHIVNLASAAGLVPVPAMGIYGSTKFAIVGLSHALRNEAKDLGVKVSVVCPSLVNTPIYDTAVYDKVDKAKFLKTRSSFQTPEAAARRILKGVSKNQTTIHTVYLTRFSWWVYRLSPALYGLVSQRLIRSYRKRLRRSDQTN